MAHEAQGVDGARHEQGARHEARDGSGATV
jgi:hypothetical protein